MRVRLITSTATHAVVTADGAKFATVPDLACECGQSPLRIRGENKRIAEHDVYKADAVSACCGRHIGTVVARVPTLFGLEEDEAILLHGRARVYW